MELEPWLLTDLMHKNNLFLVANPEDPVTFTIFFYQHSYWLSLSQVLINTKLFNWSISFRPYSTLPNAPLASLPTWRPFIHLHQSSFQILSFVSPCRLLGQCFLSFLWLTKKGFCYGFCVENWLHIISLTFNVSFLANILVETFGVLILSPL